MAVQKFFRFTYLAKFATTGLTDITCQVKVNNVTKAVSTNAISSSPNANGSVITEMDATNMKGEYDVLLSAADLTAWGITQTTANFLELYINSASMSAPANFSAMVTLASLDDIDLKLGTPAGASVSADIAAVKADTAAIKVDVETAASSLPNIYAALTQLQNNAGFAVGVPATMIIPSTGSTPNNITFTSYDSTNDLINVDANAISVTLKNGAGVDRSSYLTGASGGAAPMVHDSLGQYHIICTIPAGAPEESLNFMFSYAIGGKSTARSSSSTVVADANASGFALQSTLLLVKADTDATQAIVSNGTYGNQAINTVVTNVQSVVTNATYGNAALQAQGVTTQGLVTGLQGTGFVSTTDSNHAIKAFLVANVYFGGIAK